MKKTLSMLLAAAMLLAVAPMTVSANENDDINAKLQSADNLAYGKDVLCPDNALNIPPTWMPSNLTDGVYSTDGGYHSAHPVDFNHTEWVGVDLGEKKTFDTLVAYPVSNLGFPNAFKVEVSNDGIDWGTLTITTDGSYANAAKEIYNFPVPSGAVTINFPKVTARYVRFDAISLNLDENNLYGLKLSEMAIYNTNFKYSENEYTYSENIVKGKIPTFLEGATHPGDYDGWWTAGVGLTDGDRYNINHNGSDLGCRGQYVGFHSALNVPRLDFYYDLGEGSTFNQLVIYPSTTKYARITEANDGLHLPDAFEFYYSADLENWTKLNVAYNKADYTEYNPIVLNLDKVYGARYFRIAFDRPADNVKLSELEIYDTTKKLTVKPNEEKTVTTANVNLAIGAKVIFSGIIPAGLWHPIYLNNGAIEELGGFTSNSGGADINARLWVGYDLGAVTKINTLALVSAQSDAEADANWSGIPRKFEIQVSDDGFNWTTVKTVDNGETAPAKDQPCTYEFEDQDARYIRVLATESYPKGSDGNNCYVQLAEMEVRYAKTVTDPTDPGQTPDKPTTPVPTGDVTLAVAVVALMTVLSGAAIMIKRRRYQ